MAIFVEDCFEKGIMDIYFKPSEVAPIIEPGMSFSKFVQDYLINLNHKLGELSNRFNSISGKRVLSRQLDLLCGYLEARYMEGYPSRTEAEFLKLAQMRSLPGVFIKLLDQLVYTPFGKIVPECEEPSFREIHECLNNTVHAINQKELIQRLGAGNDKSYHFLFDMYKLSLLEYRFTSFRDIELETLYSNDGINLTKPSTRTFVNRFFRFFIDGDGKEGKYNPASYYGCLPVLEERIKVYCERAAIPQKYVDKLLSIAQNSNRFIVENKDDSREYSLKIQYITGTEALAAAILYRAGRNSPMTKEELYARIEKLHNQYPRLVASTKGNAWHPSRKPILCSAGKKDLWTLEVWRTNKGDVLHDIREFVSEEYKRTGNTPVRIERICEYLRKLGYTYDKATLRKAYISKSGCKNVRHGLYVPADSDEPARGRYWRGKMYLLQREIARLIIANKRPLSRSEIVEFINQGLHPVSKDTLNKAIVARKDLFQITGNTSTQKIGLTDKIRKKTDINIQIPKPETTELPYVTDVRDDIVAYLLKNEREYQSELVKLFKDKIPNNLKSRESALRVILHDKTYFVKEKVGDKKIGVTLEPTYRKRLELERPVEQVAPSLSPQINEFSWDGLKKGIMRQILQDDQDDALSEKLDKVFFIFRSGRDEFLPNSNFVELVKSLFKYVTDRTSPEERRDLQRKMLSMMEAFFKEFYRLEYGGDLGYMKNLGEVRFYFQEQGILPDREKKYLDRPELEITRMMDSVNRQRNRDPGHPLPVSAQSDKQAIIDIHNCLSLMVYVVGKK